MKRTCTVTTGLVALTALVLLLGSCSTGGGSGPPAENIRSSTLSLGGGSAPSGGAVAAGSLQAGDRIYFRSSDIEFWQITGVGDLENIVSAKWAGTIDYSSGHSLEYRLGDAIESIVFVPDRDVVVGVNRTDLNSDWAARVAAFVGAGKTGVNAMRLDIGSGAVTFEIGGGTPEVFTADLSGSNGIDGNSIFFVDDAMLTRPILVNRRRHEEMTYNGATAETLDLGLSSAECAIVDALHLASTRADQQTRLDLHGALYVPMDPVDLTGFDPATETLDIVITWNLADAVHQTDGRYVMDDRVGCTCFDFEVTVERNPK